MSTHRSPRARRVNPVQIAAVVLGTVALGVGVLLAANSSSSAESERSSAGISCGPSGPSDCRDGTPAPSTGRVSTSPTSGAIKMESTAETGASPSVRSAGTITGGGRPAARTPAATPPRTPPSPSGGDGPVDVDVYVPPIIIPTCVLECPAR